MVVLLRVHFSFRTNTQITQLFKSSIVEAMKLVFLALPPGTILNTGVREPMMIGWQKWPVIGMYIVYDKNSHFHLSLNKFLQIFFLFPRLIIERFANITDGSVIGVRAPYLRVGGNTQFQMMNDQFFVYDSSIAAPLGRVPMWPYTLLYRMPHKCHGKFPYMHH